MSENNDKNLTKPLNPVADSQIHLPETLSEDKKEKYNKPVDRLKKRQEEASYREELENQEIEDRKSNRQLREKYANKMFWYMCIWSVIVLLILVCSGLQCFDFQLDKWVLVTLIGSTTISVFSIVRAIIEGLFKHKN